MQCYQRVVTILAAALVSFPALPSGASGQILFQDDFNHPRLEPLGGPGEWHVTNGVLRGEGTGCSQAEEWLVLGSPDWTTYQVDFDFRMPALGGAFSFGSRFDPAAYAEQVPAFFGFIAGVSSHYAGGTVDQDIIDCGVGTEECNPGGSTTGGQVAIYSPDWHHFTAQIDPTSLIVSIDGKLVGSQSATCSLSPGSFALGNRSQCAGSVEIDNMTVAAATPVSTRTDATWGRIKATWR